MSHISHNFTVEGADPAREYINLATTREQLKEQFRNNQGDRAYIRAEHAEVTHAIGELLVWPETTAAMAHFGRDIINDPATPEESRIETIGYLEQFRKDAQRHSVAVGEVEDVLTEIATAETDKSTYVSPQRHTASEKAAASPTATTETNEGVTQVKALETIEQQPDSFTLVAYKFHELRDFLPAFNIKAIDPVLVKDLVAKHRPQLQDLSDSERLQRRQHAAEAILEIVEEEELLQRLTNKYGYSSPEARLLGYVAGELNDRAASDDVLRVLTALKQGDTLIADHGAGRIIYPTSVSEGWKPHGTIQDKPEPTMDLEPQPQQAAVPQPQRKMPNLPPAKKPQTVKKPMRPKAAKQDAPLIEVNGQMIPERRRGHKRRARIEKLGTYATEMATLFVESLGDADQVRSSQQLEASIQKFRRTVQRAEGKRTDNQYDIRRFVSVMLKGNVGFEKDTKNKVTAKVVERLIDQAVDSVGK